MKEFKNDTEYLNSIPDMAESIIDGANTPIEECLDESDIDWTEENHND